MAQDPWAQFRVSPAQTQPVPQETVVRQVRDPREEARKQAAENRAQVDQSLQIEAANRARTDQQLQLEEARRKRLEWEATHNPDGTPKVAQGAGKALREGDANKLSSMGDNLSTFDRLTGTFKDDFAGNTLTGGLENSIQNAYSRFGTEGQAQWWADVAAFDNVVRNSQFGASLTPGEKAEYDKTTINPSMDPKIIRDNLSRRMKILQQSAQRKVNGLKAAGWNKDEIDAYIGAQLGDIAETTPPTDGPDANPPVAGMNSGVSTDPRVNGNIPGANGGGPQAMQQGDTKTVAMAGVESRYRQLLGSGASGDELAAYLQSVGITDPNVLISAKQQANYRDRFPKVPIDSYPVNFTQDLPVSGADQALNAVGQSAGGAYVINAADMLSGGTLDNIAGAMGGNAERVRASMGAISDANPVASTLGQVSGGVLAGLTAEAGLARAGVAQGLGRGVLADSAIGSAYGAGSADNGNRVQNALLGAATSAAGSAAGTMGTNALARMATPTGRGANALYDAGVTPTIGQRGAAMAEQGGFKGAVGNMVSSAEQKLQSIPVIGSAIRGARQEARDQFQIGAFNEALKEVGEQLPKGMKPGTAPNAYAQKTFDRVYAEARSGMRMVADEELANDLGSLSGDLASLGPQAMGKFKAVIDNFVNNRAKQAGGELAGETYKRTISDLDKKVALFRKGQTSEDQGLADAIENVKFALENAARRHSDPESVALLDAADAGYAKLVRIEGAAARAGGDAGTFTPNQFNAEVQKQSGTIRSKSFLRGEALMQDYAQQGKALSDTVPNSGTVDRVLAAGALVGGTALSAKAAALFGGLLGAYAPGTRKVMQKALSPAGPRRQAIARQLEKRARLVGSTTAATGAALSQGTSPGQ